jgi:hypothetical protein
MVRALDLHPMTTLTLDEGRSDGSPLYQIRMAASAEDPSLAVMQQAAQRRHNAASGKPVTTNALFNAERNGPDVRTSTVVEWSEAWGWDISILAFTKAEASQFAHSFRLSTLPEGVTWKAMAAMLAAMDYVMRMRLVKREETGAAG